MQDDPDFDLYNDALLDEAFTDFLNGSPEGGISALTRFTLDAGNSLDDDAVPAKGSHFEGKVPRETIDNINVRLAQATVSPFVRFRMQRGTLSVCRLWNVLT
jgi:hypothetical protein